jgi:hypothetical protein
MTHDTAKTTRALQLMAAALLLGVTGACSSHTSTSSSSPSGSEVAASYTELANCAPTDTACNQQAAQALHDAIKGCFDTAAQCRADAADGGSDALAACHDELHACLEANRPPLPPCLEQLRSCVMAGSDIWGCVTQARQCIRDEIAALHDRDGGFDEGDDNDGGCDHHGGFGGGFSKGGFGQSGGFFGGGRHP